MSTTKNNHQSSKVKPGNPYTNFHGWLPRQKLAEDLIIQIIRMSGTQIKYIPKEMFIRDPLYGDDNFVKFNYAFEIEAIVKNVDSYEGQQEIFSKFDLELRDQITFTISRRRWKESNEHKLLDETGLPIEDESSPTWKPYSTVTISEQNGDGPDYNVVSDIPKVGDLIYFPLVDKIFEIIFVEHESLFYQHGTLLTYDLKCELFRYSNEEFETNDEDIDIFNTLLNTDENKFPILDENDPPDEIKDEDGDFIVDEKNLLIDKDKQADNDYIQEKGEELIDYSEQSPLINSGKY